MGKKLEIPVEITIGDDMKGRAVMTITIEGRSSIIDGRAIGYPEIVDSNRLMKAFTSKDIPSFLRALADEIEADGSKD